MKTVKKDISSYIIQSQEEELKRIAFELHEGVGQTLYSLYTGMQFVETNIENPDLKAFVNEMGQLLEKTIQETRLLSVELHPPTLTTLGLIAALKSYLKLFTTTYGVLVDFQESGTESILSQKDNITLFRVCQEALVNIAKYADTNEVKMMTVWERDSISIEIKDFGRGFDVIEGMNQSTGLAAMEERMQLAGGKCIITSDIGLGTTVNIYLPFVKQEHQ